ncbi:hypothetical protein SEVIR_5G395133v4 [Setaria viridis]|uniref:Uncharacterized protein n=1 Tax=Setaria viridis TaxID=4556 RepID=A0A4U6UNH6_SETVI|nr:hypothetical protein SEVIR_5G395133v2 [Setaria viridis]
MASRLGAGRDRAACASPRVRSFGCRLPPRATEVGGAAEDAHAARGGALPHLSPFPTGPHRGSCRAPTRCCRPPDPHATSRQSRLGSCRSRCLVALPVFVVDALESSLRLSC